MSSTIVERGDTERKNVPRDSSPEVIGTTPGTPKARAGAHWQDLEVQTIPKKSILVF